MKLVDKIKALLKRKPKVWNGKVLFNGEEYQSMDEALPKIMDEFFKKKEKPDKINK